MRRLSKASELLVAFERPPKLFHFHPASGIPSKCALPTVVYLLLTDWRTCCVHCKRCTYVHVHRDLPSSTFRLVSNSIDPCAKRRKHYKTDNFLQSFRCCSVQCACWRTSRPLTFHSNVLWFDFVGLLTNRAWAKSLAAPLLTDLLDSCWLENLPNLFWELQAPWLDRIGYLTQELTIRNTKAQQLQRSV